MKWKHDLYIAMFYSSQMYIAVNSLALGRFGCQSSNRYQRFMYWTFAMKLPSMLQKQIDDMSTRSSNGLVRQATWATVDPDRCCCMESQRVKFASYVDLRVFLLLVFNTVNSTWPDDKHTKLQKVLSHWRSRTYIPADGLIINKSGVLNMWEENSDSFYLGPNVLGTEVWLQWQLGWHE